MRIPRSELERIQSEVRLVATIEARGVRLEPQREVLRGDCPFHDDHERSLVVEAAKGEWQCTGACRSGGTVIEWVMKAERISFRLAYELLRRKLTVLPADARTRAKLGDLAEPFAPDEELLARIALFYHECLLRSPEALNYLDRLGLGDAALISRLQLGYGDRTLAYRLPQKQVAAGAAIRGQLQRLGVLRESGHELFSGRIVIPIFGPHGEVLDLQGRRTRRDLRNGTPEYACLPRRADGRRPVFNLAGLRSSRDVILCDTILDAMTFCAAGYQHVTVAYGVDGLSDELVGVLRDQATRRAFIAYRRTESGEGAAAEVAAAIAKHGIASFRLWFPRDCSVSMFTRSVRPAALALAPVLAAARWIAGPKSPEPPHRSSPSRSEATPC